MDSILVSQYIPWCRVLLCYNEGVNTILVSQYLPVYPGAQTQWLEQGLSSLHVPWTHSWPNTEQYTTHQGGPSPLCSDGPPLLSLTTVLFRPEFCCVAMNSLNDFRGLNSCIDIIIKIAKAISIESRHFLRDCFVFTTVNESSFTLTGTSMLTKVIAEVCYCFREILFWLFITFQSVFTEWVNRVVISSVMSIIFKFYFVNLLRHLSIHVHTYVTMTRPLQYLVRPTAAV